MDGEAWGAAVQEVSKSYQYLRREAKIKGERERYTELKAEFQRIARRDKNAFLRVFCLCSPLGVL